MAMNLLSILFLLLIFGEKLQSQNLTQSYTLATWSESRKLCRLAGQSELCKYSHGHCSVRLSDQDAAEIFSYPLWINGIVSRPPWIVHVGCTEVKDYLLYSNSIPKYKLTVLNDITECVSLCGNSAHYGVSGSFCYCLKKFQGKDTNLENCGVLCSENTCKNVDSEVTNITSSDLIYLNIYKHYQVAGNLSVSQWDSCVAMNTTTTTSQTTDCRSQLPFVCFNTSGDLDNLYVHNTRLTWYEARTFCYARNRLLVNFPPSELNNITGLHSEMLYWTGAFRPLQWIWDPEELPSYKFDCLVLNKEDNGTISIQSRDCDSKAIAGLCLKDAPDNMTYNSSLTPRLLEPINKKSNENGNNTAYIGIGIGSGVVFLAVVVAVVMIARRRTLKSQQEFEKIKNIMNGAADNIELTPLEFASQIASPNTSQKEYTGLVVESDKQPESVNRSQDKETESNNKFKQNNKENKQLIKVTIEHVPEKSENKKSKKSERKHKTKSFAKRELEVSDYIEDESVTIVDDGSNEIELSQTV